MSRPTNSKGTFAYDVKYSSYNLKWSSVEALESWKQNEERTKTIELKIVDRKLSASSEWRRYICRRKNPKCKCRICIKIYPNTPIILGLYDDEHSHPIGIENLPFTTLPYREAYIQKQATGTATLQLHQDASNDNVASTSLGPFPQNLQGLSTITAGVSTASNGSLKVYSHPSGSSFAADAAATINNLQNDGDFMSASLTYVIEKIDTLRNVAENSASSRNLLQLSLINSLMDQVHAELWKENMVPRAPVQMWNTSLASSSNSTPLPDGVPMSSVQGSMASTDVPPQRQNLEPDFVSEHSTGISTVGHSFVSSQQDTWPNFPYFGS